MGFVFEGFLGYYSFCIGRDALVLLSNLSPSLFLDFFVVGAVVR